MPDATKTPTRPAHAPVDHPAFPTAKDWYLDGEPRHTRQLRLLVDAPVSQRVFVGSPG